MHRVVVGDDNPEEMPDENRYRNQFNLLNRCLSDSPRGKIIGQEKCSYIQNVGEHEVERQYMVYHIGFAIKPVWIEEQEKEEERKK